MSVDVLIVYELRNREIENASLIAAEMIKRGYRVKIRNVLSLSRYFSKPKVVIAPHLYDDFQVTAISKNYWKQCDAIIDLQYEQVLSKNAEDGIHNPKGEAVHAHHVAWGEKQFQRYATHGIELSHIHTIGNISMDLMREQFEGFFLTKEELGKEFNLDSSKEWVLFISSFSYANRSKEEIESFEKLNKDAKEFAEVSNSSYKTIINWLYAAAIEHPDQIFIYRRHPAELDFDITTLVPTIPRNLVFIDKYSSRQWVKSCDLLYTWISTVIVDAYYAKKRCGILRPISIPKQLDSDLLVDLDYITDYDSFEKSLEEKNGDVSLDGNKIVEYYGCIDEKPTYKKVADLCEGLLKNQLEKHKYKYKKGRLNILDSNSLKLAVENFILAFLFDVCTVCDLTKIFKKKGRNTILKFYREGYKVNKDITQYIERFKMII